MKKFKSQKGFTLIEILVVIGIIAVLAVIVLIAINPGRQFAQSRDTQRTSNVNAILNAIGQNIADNKGVFTCATALPNTATDIGKSTLDIRSCLVPTYMSELPYDPKTGSNNCTGDCTTSGQTYDTQYKVVQDNTTKRITVSAVGEITTNISVTR